MDLTASTTDLEHEITFRTSEIERLRAESRIFQAELDRRATEAKAQAEVARFAKMSPADRLAILKAIADTQSIEAAPVHLSADVTVPTP